MYFPVKVKALRATFFFAFPCYFLHIYLHQDQVTSNLAYVAQVNDIFFLPAQHTKKPAWPRHYDMGNLCRTQVKFHIFHKSKAFPITDIDHFFFFQITDSHILHFFCRTPPDTGIQGGIRQPNFS